MERLIKEAILRDIYKKIILITGPRQVGKTTLSKDLLKKALYLNYDYINDRKQIHKSDIDFNHTDLILDELHKMKNWKRWLKGHYDVRQNKKAIIVTGSAKLDTYRKMGESLAGRFYQFSLFPFDVKEIVSESKTSSEKALDQLMVLSGFPEPYLSNSEKEYKRWRRTHQDIILKQDLLEIDSASNIQQIELLMQLLTERIGSPLSYNSLREDLNVDDKTIKRWCIALTNLYVLFSITPYSKKIKYSLTKSAKYYFFDYPRVKSESIRFENLVALALYKEVVYRNEVLGEDCSLHYLRNKNKAEVDFLICENQKPILMIETKWSDNNLNHHFSIFEKFTGPVKKIILVRNLKKETVLKDDIKVYAAHKWLSQMKW